MSKTTNNKRELTNISNSIGSTSDKYNQFSLSSEDETKKLILRYFTMLSFADKKTQISKNVKAEKSQQHYDKSLKSKKGVKNVRKLKQMGEEENKNEQVDDNNASDSKKVARNNKKFSEKLLFLAKKLGSSFSVDKNKKNLKEYILNEPKAYDELLDIISSISNLYLKHRLKNFIEEIQTDLKSKSKPESSKTFRKTAISKQKSFKKISKKSKEVGPKKVNIKENFNNELSTELLKPSLSSPQHLVPEAESSVKDSDKKKSSKRLSHSNIESNKQVNNKSTNFEGDLDNELRRKSSRLSAHPQGYFQTKPFMVCYYEIHNNKRNRSMSIKRREQEDTINEVKVRRHTLPKAKRRKLYNHT